MQPQFIFWPSVILLIIVSLDVFRLLQGKKQKKKISFSTVLAVSGFFLYYAFFINSGITAVTFLFNREIYQGSGEWLSVIFLPISYALIKWLYYRYTKSSLPKNNASSFQIFLHYFVFTTSSVILFVFLFFVIWAIKLRLFI